MSIRITARPAAGIRRVGVFHPAEPVVFPDGYFSDEEVEILRKDRDLHIEILEESELASSETRKLKLVDRHDREVEAIAERNGVATTLTGGGPGVSPSGGGDSAKAPGGDVSEQQQKPADVAGDQVKREEAKDIPTPPAVADLETFLADITDLDVVLEMQRRDTRKSAQPIYEAWIDQLTLGASRQGG